MGFSTMLTARLRLAVFLLLVAAIPCFTVGCSTRNDVHFNPYNRGGSRGTLMQQADELVEHAERALDNLDARLDNAVW